MTSSVIPAHVVAVVLAAALLHASWNALIRGAPDKGLYTLMMHACSALVACVGLIFIGLPAPASWPWLIASALLHTLYILLLMRAYKEGQLAVSYVLMRGLAPLAVCLASAPLLGESLPALAWAGVLCIVLGVLGIALGSGAPVLQALRSPANLAALGNAIVIAAYTLVDGQGARLSGNTIAYVLALALLEPMVILLYTLRTRPRAFLNYTRAHWPLGLLGGCISMASYAMALWAMTQAPIAVVATLRESSVIFAVLIGALWFKEGRLRTGLLAAGAVLTGITLIRS